MGRIAASLARDDRLLALDWLDYATALLAGGSLDWSHPAAVAGLFAKAQALLPSDLVVLPLVPFLAASVAARPALAAAIAARPGGAQPLRCLLADPGIRAGLAELVAAVARSSTSAALVLVLPDPAALAAVASRLAGRSPPTADRDLAEDAAAYVADALRSLAETPLAGVAIAETPGTPFHEFLAPIRKVAAHYGWDVGRLGPAEPSFDFALDARPLAAARPAAGLDTVTIPPDGQPEAVLAAVAALRHGVT
jgi:hypothetical protein